MEERTEKLRRKYNREKIIKLVLSLIVDIVGLMTYLIPFLGGTLDTIWAPISGISIYAMYPKRKFLALGGVIEELFTGFDIIPTATLTWINWYIYNDEKAKRQFVEKIKRDDEIFN